MMEGWIGLHELSMVQFQLTTVQENVGSTVGIAPSECESNQVYVCSILIGQQQHALSTSGSTYTFQEESPWGANSSFSHDDPIILFFFFFVWLEATMSSAAQLVRLFRDTCVRTYVREYRSRPPAIRRFQQKSGRSEPQKRMQKQRLLHAPILASS